MSRLEVGRDELEPKRFAGMIKALVVPRPIAWVSTVSAEGVDNLAPHSFFTMASEQPAIAQFTSIGRKDSLRNVLETEEFVINLADQANFELINASATEYPRDRSEFEALGIPREESLTVRPPRVASSPAALECRLHGTYAVGSGVIVLGEVQHVAVSKSALTAGRPDINLLRPMARLGGDQWSELGRVVEIRRIPYEEAE